MASLSDTIRRAKRRADPSYGVSTESRRKRLRRAESRGGGSRKRIDSVLVEAQDKEVLVTQDDAFVVGEAEKKSVSPTPSPRRGVDPILVSPEFARVAKAKEGDVAAVRAERAGGAAVSAPVSSELGEGVGFVATPRIVRVLPAESVSSSVPDDLKGFSRDVQAARAAQRRRVTQGRDFSESLSGRVSSFFQGAPRNFPERTLPSAVPRRSPILPVSSSFTSEFLGSVAAAPVQVGASAAGAFEGSFVFGRELADNPSRALEVKKSQLERVPAAFVRSFDFTTPSGLANVALTVAGGASLLRGGRIRAPETLPKSLSKALERGDVSIKSFGPAPKGFKTVVDVSPEGKIIGVQGNIRRATDPALFAPVEQGRPLATTSFFADTPLQVGSGVRVFRAAGGESFKIPKGPEGRFIATLRARKQAALETRGSRGPDRLIDTLEETRRARREYLDKEFGLTTRELALKRFFDRKGSAQVTIQLRKPSLRKPALKQRSLQRQRSAAASLEASPFVQGTVLEFFSRSRQLAPVTLPQSLSKTAFSAGQGSRAFLASAQGLSSSPAFRSALAQSQGRGLSFDQRLSFRQAFDTKQSFAQSVLTQQSLSRTFGSSSLSSFPSIVPPPKRPPRIPDFGGGGSDKFFKRSGRRGKQRFAFRPSLTAQTFNIKGKSRAFKGLSGFEVRGL